MNSAPRVLSLYGDENGCTLWRCWQPMTELQRQGHGAWFRHKDDPQTMAEEFPYLAATRLDAIVLNRLSWADPGPAQRWIRSLHDAGLAVIYEVDDDIFSRQIAERQKATTETEKPLEQLRQERWDRIFAARLCDGITVSSEELARVVRVYVDLPVYVVPNSVDLRWWRSSMRGVRRVVPPLSIGWAGGARYQEDLLPVAEAWHNIAKRYPDVQFVVQGFMADVLCEAVPSDRVKKLGWLPLDWREGSDGTMIPPYSHALKQIDIGCASVTDLHFNRCKTPIKVWEYTMAGAVSVVSPTLYGPVVTDGEDCLVAETVPEWESALARLVEDAQLRRQLWRAQRRRVAEHHSLEKNAGRWLEAWSKIIDEFRAHQPKVALERMGLVAV